MHRKVISFLIILAILLLQHVFAQGNAIVQSNESPDSIIQAAPSERDLTDVFLRLKYNQKQMAQRDSASSGSHTHIALVPAAGYALQTGFAGLLAGNIVFHTQSPTTTKASSIFTCAMYTQYHQIILPLIASIWTPHNKYHIVSDNRYLKYPSLTFGLGDNALSTKGYGIEYLYVKFHESVERKLLPNFYAGLGYYFDRFWNVRERDNTQHKGNPEPMPFTLDPEEISSSWIAKVTFDNRPRLINPSKGIYASFLLRSSSKFLGGNNNWRTGLLEIRKYFTLPGRAKNVLALWTYNWFTMEGSPGYLLLPSTGWDDNFNTGRGYIQGRFRGKDMFYFETEYRFKLLRSGLLGGTIFSNVQYFTGSPSHADKVIAPAAGLGLRIKVNKQSGTNLSIDYGFGLKGSKGFFVSLGEAF